MISEHIGPEDESNTDNGAAAFSVSRGGMPLSVNRAPSEDLAPWVARLVAARIDAPDDSLIRCGMCNDLVYARIVFKGEWTATTRDGTDLYRNEVLLFGPHSRYMPLSCAGSVISIGVGLRPGALTKLTGIKTDEIVDRIHRGDPLGLVENDLFGDYPPDGHPDQWLETLENALRRLIARVEPKQTSNLAQKFEERTFADPNFPLGEFAEAQGVSLRKLERVAKRDFGLTPKQVQRRARALDIAAQLCGVADQAEEDELLLRYFDQSHLIREFAAFFGTTPSSFRKTPRPLMTINVETRQARRLEILNRIAPGELRPWEATSER